MTKTAEIIKIAGSIVALFAAFFGAFIFIDGRYAQQGHTHELLKHDHDLPSHTHGKSELAELPHGVILPWFSREPVPTGWFVCDGANGTPDLRGRYLMGVGNAADVGTESGSTSHNHGGELTTTREFNLVHVPSPNGPDDRTGRPNSNHQHKISLVSVDHLPPSIGVIFIMKAEK